MDVETFCAAISKYPELMKLDVGSVLQFLRYALMMRSQVHHTSQTSSSDTTRPEISLTIAQVLGEIMKWPESIVLRCWDSLKHVIWSTPNVVPSEDEIERFNECALPLGICEFTTSLLLVCF